VDETRRDTSPAKVGVQDCGLYVDGVRQPHAGPHAAALERVRELGRGFVWLSIEEPSDRQLDFIAQIFDLHPLAVDDVLGDRMRPKVVRYDELLVVVMKTLRHEGRDDATNAQLAVLMGGDFVITCSRGEQPAVAAVRRQVQSSPAADEWGPRQVMRAIVDHVFDGYHDVAHLVRAEADVIEAEVFSRSSPRDLEHIYRLKRQVVRMRLSIAPLIPALREFADEHHHDISAEVSNYLRDILERSIRATERLASSDDLLDSLLDSAFGRESVQQNVDMRKIAAWAAMGAVPTTIAAIYGMNFDNMPELHWTWGYPAALLLMAVIVVILHRVFRRRRWI
jgi:magnesium transporter